MKKLLQPLFKIFESHSAISAVLTKPSGIYRTVNVARYSGMSALELPFDGDLFKFNDNINSKKKHMLENF